MRVLFKGKIILLRNERLQHTIEESMKALYEKS